MILRTQPGERLWDSWLFDWQGTMHLFYLASMDGQGRIGHATSSDLIHWERRKDILLSHWPFTGMTLRHDGRFYLFVGEQIGNCQTTVLYQSDDLDNWRRVCPHPVAKPQPPHYRTADDPWGQSVAWRDPYVFWRQEDGHYHMLICATAPLSTGQDTGARIGHARSKDLLHWELLPPLDAPTGRFYHAEVPEHLFLNGMHYLLFTTGSVQGIRVNTPDRRETVGTYYMMADRFEGPYRLPENPLLIGAGYHRMASYVGRMIDFEATPLLYHHIRDDSSYWNATWAAPKRLLQKSDGALELAYWPGLEGLETHAGLIGMEQVPEVFDSQCWTKSTDALRGSTLAVGGACLLARDQRDIHLACAIRAVRGKRCGLILRSADQHGIQVSLDYELGLMEVGYGRYHPALGWGADITRFAAHADERDQRYLHDSCRMPLQHGRKYRLRVFSRDQHLDVYLDDRWVFTSVFKAAAMTGDVEFFVEQAEAEMADLRIATLEPLLPSTAAGEVWAEPVNSDGSSHPCTSTGS